MVSFNPDGSFSYTPNADFTGDDIFTYKANDGALDSNTATVTVTVNPVNDAPDFLTTLDGAPVFTEDGAPVVLDADVQIFDTELSPADNFAGATLTLVRNGGASADDLFSATGNLGALIEGNSLVLSGLTIGTVTTNSAGTLVLTFNINATQARVNETLRSIAYANSNDVPPASVQVDWDFSDGNIVAQGSGGALSATGSTTVSIITVNDAPTLNAATLAAVNEDTISPAGDTVSNIFIGKFSDPDAGSSMSGIAVVGNTANPITEGAWQYSTNGGTNWFDIGSVADNNSALALSTATLIRFVPVADFAGSPAVLEVRGLDDTYVAGFSDTTGIETRVNIDTTISGGATAIAATSANLDTTITGTNDAPVLGNGNLASIPQDTANPAGVAVATIFNGQFSDVDATGSLAGVAMVGNTANAGTEGAWQYSTNAGTNWFDIGLVGDDATALAVSDTTLIRFVPVAGYSGYTDATGRAWTR